MTEQKDIGDPVRTERERGRMFHPKTEEKVAKGEFQAWFRPAVALLLIVLSFITMGGLLWMTPPEDRAQFIMLVFGFVSGSCLAPVVQYVFGTSQGSASKQAVQGQLLERVVK